MPYPPARLLALRACSTKRLLASSYRPRQSPWRPSWSCEGPAGVRKRGCFERDKKLTEMLGKAILISVFFLIFLKGVENESGSHQLY
jgi:hypothetical protein